MVGSLRIEILPTPGIYMLSPRRKAREGFRPLPKFSCSTVVVGRGQWLLSWWRGCPQRVNRTLLTLGSYFHLKLDRQHFSLK